MTINFQISKQDYNDKLIEEYVINLYGYYIKEQFEVIIIPNDDYYDVTIKKI